MEHALEHEAIVVPFEREHRHSDVGMGIGACNRDHVHERA